MVYNKLVRDNIPDIIRKQGKNPCIRILEAEAYTHALEQKLDEETAEFHKEKNLEELADILEVVYALAEDLGSSKAELHRVYEQKHEARGGFEKKYLLIRTENS